MTSIINEYEKAAEAIEPADTVDYSQESAINWLKGQEMMTVTFPGMSNHAFKIRKLAKQNPDDIKILVDRTEGLVAYVPVSYLRFQKPQEPRKMTEEERKAARERIEKYQFKKREPSND